MADETAKKVNSDAPAFNYFENSIDSNKPEENAIKKGQKDYFEEEKPTLQGEQEDKNEKYIAEALKIYKEFFQFFINSSNKNKENIKIILENEDKRAKELFYTFRKKYKSSKTEEEKEKIYISYREEMKELRNHVIEEIKNVNSNKEFWIGIGIGILIGVPIGIPMGVAIYKKIK